MALDPENKWTKAIGDLKPTKVVADAAAAMAKTVDGLVTGKAGLKGITGKLQFTFPIALFQTGLLGLAPLPDASAASQAWAMAWGNAVLTSIMVIPSGAIFGAASPKTTWSAPPVVVLLPPSVQAAQLSLATDLAAAGADPAKKADDNKLGAALRKAFLLLQFSATGLDTTPTPAGPLPLIVPAVSLM